MKEMLKDKRNWFLLAWPIGFGLYFLAVNSKEAAENVCARGIFRFFGGVMSRISGIIPFSLAELLLILFALFVPTMMIITVIRLIRRKKRLLCVTRALRDTVIMVGIIFAWFMLGGGVNYYRYEFADYCGLEIQKSTKEELFELCMSLSQKANAARDALGVSESQPYISQLTNRERAKEAQKAMIKLSGEYEVLEGYYPVPKSVFFSRAMSEFNITGVYFPWTVEANVNVDIPDYSKGSVLCHELSHLRGFMREDEANYIGYLAAVNSDSAELRYSGYMSALINSGNRLYSEDMEMYYAVAATYSEGLRTDMRASHEYWKDFEDTVLSEAGETMNNVYLKANSISDGTKSYGRMVDLLLAEFRLGKDK